MVWWEAVLSPALQVLFDKLASGDILELLRRWNINDLLLEKLKIAYFTCTVVLDDAEEKQYFNPAIQTWLDMLKDAVCEAEDALDFLATEALRCKVELSPQSLSNQIIEKLEFIAKQKGILGLESSGKGIHGMMHRTPTTPLVVESCIYGRENEKEDIINLLLADDGTNNQGFSVIPIVGMGGIGKTTLAQIVYNDKRIDEAFDVKAWACELSDTQCWLLFQDHTLENEDSEKYLSLRQIGREIVKKCQGLPLAVKMLGGLLASKLDAVYWNQVLNSNLWDLPQKKNSILPSLRLSYHHLPPNLKRCFAYCSIFPKGYEFERKNLVLLWMAEGFVQPGAKISMEEVGDEYFSELLSRSFFQESALNRSRYVMHDLINDLAGSVSRISCVRQEENWQREHLECCYFITELPESIGNLRLLRYLDLSYTRIKSLPESLNVLYNLQTLLLCDCADLNNLPANIGKLINLRHLDISGSGIQAMPIGVENLVSLRSLPEFVLGNVGPRGSATQEMPIGGSLSLSGLENVDNLWDAKNANLKGKQKLTTLVMEWSSTLSELQNDRVATDVLEMLQPHQNLEKLTIKGYNGRKFPTWIGDPSFSKLECLSVTDCKRCRSLPPLGSLLSLKHLYIKGMDAVKSIGAEFYGYSSSSSKTFASLETLTFEDMMEWEEWLLPTSDGHMEAFPSLQELQIEKCPKLRQQLPQQLPSLVKLHLTEYCPRLELVPGTTFPSNLQGLVLRGCGLDLLPEPMINNITSLEYLCIGGCLVLSSFPGEGRQVPTTFKQLTIDQCPNLEFLPEGITHSSNISLELLEIFDCPSITSFPAGHLPATLKVLTIWNCCNLESLEDIATDSMSLESLRIGNCTNLIFLPKCLNKLGCLDYLEIDGCPGIVSFPQGGLPSRSLKKLHILDCENLMFLPELMLSLTSLKELKLSNCPSIASLPDGGFPINLVSLEVKDCENITPLSKWGLHRLASLEKLKIHGGFLDVSLSPWLQHLSSLEELKIMECHELFNLPKEGVPPMLSFLEIRGCPKLQQTCEKNWSEIDHIPCISNHL
ncbi:unnamed protein product [Coffea canephora]|uniref:DH200=94 genomic scaffold, scaffold_191 n=1 Tax=Coffea canephora TaxID=49390 RepID=A0A068VE23_COFCA|nr:unnamed protein product [Coffea canephora]